MKPDPEVDKTANTGTCRYKNINSIIHACVIKQVIIMPLYNNNNIVKEHIRWHVK